MARKVEGAAAIRSLFRQLPNAARDEMGDVLEESGRSIATLMRGKTPRRTGALQSGILHRVQRQTLRLRVGLLNTKKGRATLFYGRILDLGRKGQTVTAHRKRPGGGVNRYTMRVKAIAAKRFVTGRYPDTRNELNTRLKGVWDRILRRTAGGGNG